MIFYEYFLNQYSKLKTNVYLSVKLVSLCQKYPNLKKIGQGKDGAVYLAKTKSTTFVVKLLTRHAKKYNFLAKIFSEQSIKNSHLIQDLQIYDDYHLYTSFKFSQPETTPEKFLSSLKQICDLETILLRKGLFFWDLGVSHANYVLLPDKTVILTDYGGSGWLLTDNRFDPLIPDKNYKRNLVKASQLFIKAALLLHIVCFGLGKKQFNHLGPKIQLAKEDELKKYVKSLLKETIDTPYEKFCKAIYGQNPVDEGVWKKAKSHLQKNKNEIKTQETADIDKVVFKKNRATITGYQNYEITDKDIYPLTGKTSSLWNTDKKLAIVKASLDKITTSTKRIGSLADVGSNLGLYVFLAKIKYKINYVEGFDYNKKYISICKKITKHINLKNCQFSIKNFSEIKRSYDVTIFMGLIHHLYHRTERYGSLEPIVKQISNMTNKYAIIEFPLESDKKAKKWVEMPGRVKKEKYSQRNFLRYAKRHFNKIEEIDTIKKTRITYLLEK